MTQEGKKEKHKNLEFKVTPYQIVNMTSKRLLIRRLDKLLKKSVEKQQMAMPSNPNDRRHRQQSRQGPQAAKPSKGGRYQSHALLT